MNEDNRGREVRGFCVHEEKCKEDLALVTFCVCFCVLGALVVCVSLGILPS